MPRFEQQYEEWLVSNLKNESNHRRKELLGKGLGHGTVEFLRKVWFPAIGNFDYRRTQAKSAVGVVIYRQIHCDGCFFHINLA